MLMETHLKTMWFFNYLIERGQEILECRQRAKGPFKCLLVYKGGISVLQNLKLSEHVNERFGRISDKESIRNKPTNDVKHLHSWQA